MTGPEQSDPELSRDAFGIKELLTMLKQEKIDIAEVLNIIEEELQTPSPDPADIEASEEYRTKMRLLNELVQRERGRSAELRKFQEMIDQRIQDSPTSD